MNNPIDLRFLFKPIYKLLSFEFIFVMKFFELGLITLNVEELDLGDDIFLLSHRLSEMQYKIDIIIDFVLGQ